MDTPSPYRRIGLFLTGLAAVFAASVAVGAAVEPVGSGSGGQMEAHESAELEPAGLGISDHGYTLQMSPTQLQRAEERELRFSIDGPDGAPITDFDELHERRIHLIVVRRDGTEFRHLHPEMDRAGTWTVPIEFGAAGVYRAFADFSVEGEQQTLARDLFVTGGDFEPRPFPAPRPVYETNGYEVGLDSDGPVAGEPASLVFAVGRDGGQVDNLAPYLGAKGHLVALREGDLAFLHVHPEDGGAANEVAFEATFPTPGRYRLYLQFNHEGTVQTAQFTVTVGR